MNARDGPAGKPPDACPGCGGPMTAGHLKGKVRFLAATTFAHPHDSCRWFFVPRDGSGKTLVAKTLHQRPALRCESCGTVVLPG